MRKILVVFLAVTFIPLTCVGGFADMDVCDYTLGGYIALGGGIIAGGHRHHGYLEKYVPFPEGPLAEADLSLKSKDGLEYYNFSMLYPGLRAYQNYLLQVGKLGVYHMEVEYDQLQNLYCTVNPFDPNMGIILQRLRFMGWYAPTVNTEVFAENTFLKRNGVQPGTVNGGPSSGYNFATFLRPIDYQQNDMKAGFAYSDRIYQARVSYHLSTFDNALSDLQVTGATGAHSFATLPPSNMANYITGEGAVNLQAYKTRLTSSFSYGWLTQNDSVINSTTGMSMGDAGLSASTISASLGGVSRPCDPLTVRYSYRAYNFQNNDVTSGMILRAFTAAGERPLLNQEQYSYLRQYVNVGTDYRVCNSMAFTLGYAFQNAQRTFAQGETTSNAPQIGFRLFPCSWMNLIANYSYIYRTGSDFMVADPTTFKFYAGNDKRNVANLTAEFFPANNVTFSANFSFFNDDFSGSSFGLRNDQGWSAGADISWRPFDRVALSLGYDHQQLSTKTFADVNESLVTGDAGPTLRTTDAYDAFTARADFKLIPNKLRLTSSASYSFSTSDFHNSLVPNLKETFLDVSTFLTYKFTEHWACRVGYTFELFDIPHAYETLYLTGIRTSPPFTPSQKFNTLDGYWRDSTVHLVQGFLQYKF